MPTLRSAALAVVLVLLAAACRSPHAVDRYGALEVVPALSSPDAGKRDWAEKSLAMSEADAAWPPLAELFRDPSKSAPAARIAAIRIFSTRASYDRPFPPPAVKAVIDDPDVEVRRAALHATIAFGDPANRVWLDAASHGEKDPAFKAEIDKALAEEWKPHAIAWWRDLVEHSTNENEVVLAIRALGHNGGPEETAFLIDQWEKRTDDRSRSESLLALSRLKGDAALKFVREQLTSTNDFVRSAAAASEIPLKDPEAVPALATMLASDSIGDLRVSAARALGATGGDAALKALQDSCKAPSNNVVKSECDLAKKAARGGASKQAKR